MQSINVRGRNLQHAACMLLVGGLVHCLMSLQQRVVWDKLGQDLLTGIGAISVRQVVVSF